MTEGVMTIEEVARRLRVSQRTVLRLLAKKEIKGYKVGRAWRFEVSDVDRYIEQQRKKAADEAA